MRLFNLLLCMILIGCNNSKLTQAGPSIPTDVPDVVIDKGPSGRVCTQAPVACPMQRYQDRENLQYTVQVTNHQDPFKGRESGYLAGTFQGRTHKGFCLEKDVFITPGKQYTCQTTTLKEGLERLRRPEMYDNILYILNQDYKNCGDGTHEICATAGEVQLAIWALLYGADNDQNHGGVSGNQAVIDAIICDALINGEGYEICPGDLTGIVVMCGDDVQMNVYPVNSCDIKVLNLTE